MRVFQDEEKVLFVGWSDEFERSQSKFLICFSKRIMFQTECFYSLVSQKAQSRKCGEIERSYSRKRYFIFRFWIYEREFIRADERQVSPDKVEKSWHDACSARRIVDEKLRFIGHANACHAIRLTSGSPESSTFLLEFFQRSIFSRAPYQKHDLSGASGVGIYAQTR